MLSQVQIDPNKVLAEIYRRSFHRFAKEAFKILHNGKEIHDNWHIEYICGVLQSEIERVISGGKRDKHIVINVPPRTLKSELVNVLFPIYCWVKRADMKIVTSSYSAALSINFSVQSRRIIESDWFKRIYPEIQLSTDENTKSKYTNKAGGLRFSTSTGGTLTGMGGDIIIVDDPQNPQLAMSETERKGSNDFFNLTLRSRLNNPDVGLFIVIMQRLHEDDLTGMLLKREPENWKHICFPAELSNNVKPIELKEKYVDGLLFPQRLSSNALSSFKTGLGSYGYSGQYMQSPSPADGGILKINWFKICKSIPEGLTIDFFMDTAYTNKSYNDATAICACGYVNNIIYIKRIEAVRMEFPELIKYLETFVRDNGYTSRSRILIEPKASGKSIVQQIKSSTSLNVIELANTTESKESRVASISATVEAGRVELLDGIWIDSFLGECASFPNGAHDDMVDAFTSAVAEYTLKSNNHIYFIDE